MRKKLALLLAALMASSTMLMACGDTTQGSSGTGSTAAGTSDEQEPVTITMAGESRIVTTLMAEKFNEQNPNITIEYKHPDGSGWISNEMLLKWAAAGDLPDIFYLQNPGVLVQNDLMLDLKPYYDADPDNQLFYQNLVQYSMVGDQMVILPYSISFYGLMVNKDLIAANNLEVPDYDWTIDELVTIAQGLTRPGSQLGLYDVTFWSSLIPQYDTSLEHAGYNRAENTWDLGEAWQTSVQICADLVVNNYTAAERLNRIPQGEDGNWDDWYAASREICGVDDPWILWQQGGVGIWGEGSYWSNWDQNNDLYPGFDWDFYPIPVAEEGNISRPTIITDSYAISKNCENPDAAYEVLKFFTYSKEGFDARCEIWEEYDAEALKAEYPEMAEAGEILDTMSFNLSPVDDQEVRDKWCELYNAKPGLRYIIDNMAESNPFIDGFKLIPGWQEVYTDIIEPALKESVWTGEKTAADVAAELQDRVNTVQQEVFAAMEDTAS